MLGRIRLITVLSLLLAWAGCLFGQDENTPGITVTVKTPEGKPLEAAQAILRRPGKVLSFGFTDASGKCRLAIPSQPADSLYLNVRLLGYKTLIVHLTPKKLDRGLLSLNMQPTAFELDEVVVKDKIPPMIERGDTLLYDAKNYRDGTERNVEALLKKLPGVEVDDNGKVSVMGKNIDKVLIEGDDVFGANYQIGTQNISAGLIDEVQIIDDYNDDPVLAGMRKTGETVINLGLEDGKEQFAFGELKLLHGFQGASDNQLNLFALRKKTKAFLIGSNNTIGAPPLSITDVGYMSGEQPGTNRQKLNAQPLLSEPSFRKPRALSEERINDNRSYQGALVLSARSSERLKARALLYGLKNGNQLNAVEQTLYYLDADTLEQSNTGLWEKQQSGLHLEAKVTYLASQRSRFRARWQLQSKNNRILSEAFTRTRLGESRLGTHYDNQPLGQSFGLSYAHRLSDGLALTAEINGVLRKNPQHTGYRSGRYREESVLGISGDSLSQSASQASHSLQAQVGALIRNGKWSGSLRLGARDYQTDMVTELLAGGLPSGAVQSLGDDFENQVGYRIREGFLMASLSRNFRRLEVKATAGLSYGENQARLPQQAAFRRLTPCIFQPGLRLAYQLSNRSSLRANWQHTRRPASAEKLLPNYYLTDYRTLRRGLDTFYINGTQNLDVRYTYTNAFKQMAFYANYSWTLLPVSEGQAIDATPWLSRSRLILNGGARTQMLKLYFEQYFPELKSNIKVNINGLDIRNENQLGSTPVQTRVNSLQANMEYRLNARDWLTPYLTAGYALQKVSNTGRAETLRLANNERFQYGGGLLIKLFEKLVFKAEANGYRWLLRGQASAALFLDASLRWHLLDDSRLSLLFRGTNLLNQGTLSHASINIYSEKALQFGLRNRILLAGLQWKF